MYSYTHAWRVLLNATEEKKMWRKFSQNDKLVIWNGWNYNKRHLKWNPAECFQSEIHSPRCTSHPCVVKRSSPGFVWEHIFAVRAFKPRCLRIAPRKGFKSATLCEPTHNSASITACCFNVQRSQPYAWCSMARHKLLLFFFLTQFELCNQSHIWWL